MKKNIIYEKKSDCRTNAYAIDTLICADENGKKDVLKSALYEEGAEHILALEKHYKSLHDLFSDSDMHPIPCTINHGAAHFPYIEGKTLEDVINEKIEREDYGGAKKLLSDYLDKLRKIHSKSDFYVTDDFIRVFGELPINDISYRTADVNNIDMVLDNIVCGEEGNYILDYEWTFYFPIPIDYILYRIIHYYVFRHPKSHELLNRGFLELIENNIEEIQMFLNMEEHFQRFISGVIISSNKRENVLRRIRQTKGICGRLYFDFGRGFHEKQSEDYEAKVEGKTYHLKCRVPEGVTSWRFDPVEQAYCQIEILRAYDEKGNDLIPNMKSNGVFIDGAWAFYETADPYFIITQNAKEVCVDYRMNRVENPEEKINERKYKNEKLKKRIKHLLQVDTWINRIKADGIQRDIAYQIWFDKNKITPEQIKIQKEKVMALKKTPQISFITNGVEGNWTFVKQMTESLLSQTYPFWEWQLALQPSVPLKIRRYLKKIAKNDNRIKICEFQKGKKECVVIKALCQISQGEYVTFLGWQDVIEPNAIYEVVSYLQKKDKKIIYTDEDCITADVLDYYRHRLKPDFAIDYLRSYFYIGNMLCIETNLLNKAVMHISDDTSSWKAELVLRCVEKTKDAGHIAKVLYHNRNVDMHPEEKMEKSQLKEHLLREGMSAEILPTEQTGVYHLAYKLKEKPLVSIIIPNKDQIALLDRAIRSIEEKSRYRHFEIIIVENNSAENATFSYYDKIKKEYKNVSVITWKKEFNFSEINNYAAKHVNGEYLLFLNNDTELIAPDAIGDMLGNAARKEVGAVGAKLLYKDDTIQHAGVIVGVGEFAGHAFVEKDAKETGYENRLIADGNYSAVTAACIMTKKSIFDEVGGLSENYRVAVNDVDFCLRLREKGYWIVYDANATWYHYESKTRGYENDNVKTKRFQNEVEQFNERWSAILKDGDPFYNPNFGKTETFIVG